MSNVRNQRRSQREGTQSYAPSPSGRMRYIFQKSNSKFILTVINEKNNISSAILEKAMSNKRKGHLYNFVCTYSDNLFFFVHYFF